MDLDKQIEAVLFWKGEPMTIQHLAESVKRSTEEVAEALKKLEADFRSRGIVYQRMGEEVALGTAPEMSKIIEALAKEELDRELSKASLETISIILYRGPIRRSEIDFIRGVNSTFIVRNLLIRGLIEKTPDPHDERAFLYKPSFDLLSHLGLTKIEDLPEYSRVKAELERWKQETEKLKEGVDAAGPERAGQ